MINPTVEALVEFQTDRWQVRLWIATSEDDPDLATQAALDAQALFLTYLQTLQVATSGELALMLARSVPRCNAAQVTDMDTGPTLGVVVYPEWP